MTRQSNLKLTEFSVYNLMPVDLEIQRGETICISGPSGSGKSLLLRAIADLIPHKGSCYLRGVDANAMAANQWRKQVSYFGAQSQWWFDTIGEHLELPLAEKLTEFLAEMGFNQANKNDDVLQWQVMRCSTGERQRLAIIRLLANSPQVLLLDEPTSNLDAENTTRVEKIIRAYQRQTQCSIIWVSHDRKQQQRVAQRHFIIKKSGLVEANK